MPHLYYSSNPQHFFTTDNIFSENKSGYTLSQISDTTFSFFLYYPELESQYDSVYDVDIELLEFLLANYITYNFIELRDTFNEFPLKEDTFANREIWLYYITALIIDFKGDFDEKYYLI